MFLQAFGEGNNSIASPNLIKNGPPGSLGNSFSSPIVAPYWTMFPPPSSPLFANTPTRCAQQPFNTFLASPYVRQANTLVNHVSTSGAVKAESVEIFTLSESDDPFTVELASTPGTHHHSSVPDNIEGSKLVHSSV